MTMAQKKIPGVTPAEYEKLLQELELPQNPPAREGKAPEYFNPWNMSKKKTPGMKRIYCTSLPDKLPE